MELWFKTSSGFIKNGLQASGALFVQEANRFHADIFIEKDGKTVNAKSIMGIMSLAIGTGSMITITTEGSDAEEALEALGICIKAIAYAIAFVLCLCELAGRGI